MRNLVYTWGKFIPPHLGHLKIVNLTKDIAKENDCDAMLFSPYPKNYPLTVVEHALLLEDAFEIWVNACRKFSDVIDYIVDCEYDSAILVVGSDRLSDFQRMLEIYQEESPRKIKLTAICGGLRDEADEAVEGLSSTKMRAFVQNAEFTLFMENLPPNIPYGKAIDLYTKLRNAK